MDERIDTREFTAPEALLLIARSMANQISDRVQVQGLTKGEGDEVGQEMAEQILGRLKHDIDGRLPHRRQVAIYPKVAGGHTHITIFTGKGYGARGRAGDIVVRNEEWQVIEYALRLIEVLLPGVFEIRTDTMEEPETVPITIDATQIDCGRLDRVVENAIDGANTESGAALAMMRWGLSRYEDNVKQLEGGIAELEGFLKRES